MLIGLIGEPLRLRRPIKLMKRAHRAQVPPERIHQTNELLFQEQHRRSGIVQDVGEFRRRQPNIERKENGLRFQNSEVGFQQPMAVQTEKGYAISRLHSGTTQRSRQTPHPIAKLGIGKAQILAHHRCLIGELLF